MSTSTSLRARAAGDVQQAQQAQQPSIAQLIATLRPEIARVLPEHLSADRMARIALTCVRRTPKLAACTPESFAGALLTAAELGLEPGVSGEAYLVPYGRECQLIIGYQGYAKLFWQHPLAKHLDAQVVCDRDDFDYAYGLAPRLEHRPALGDRGQPVAVYAVAALTSGASAFVVLSMEDVAALRAGAKDSKIADPQHWMARKTAVRQLMKLLPKSPQMAQAMATDEGPAPATHPVLTGPPARVQLEQAPPPAVVEVLEDDVDPVTGELLDDLPSAVEDTVQPEELEEVEEVEEAPAATTVPAAEPEPERASKAQVQRLSAHLRGQVATDSATRLAWVVERVGRPLTSTAHLTPEEADHLLSEFEADQQDADGVSTGGSDDEEQLRWDQR